MVEKAAKAGVGIISITDHDTILGIKRAIDAGNEHNVQIIPGIELSALFNNVEIHLLGYFIDHEDSAFCSRLDMLFKQRTERLHQMIEKLAKLDVHIDEMEVFDVVGDGAPGRLHLAEVICKTGYADDIYECFNKYIGFDGPAYVHKMPLTAKEAIELIINAKGVPVLAHPYKMHGDVSIPELASSGLQGIELVCPAQSKSAKVKFKKLAAEYELAITGGTDYHGSRKPDIKLGDYTVSGEQVEKLMNKCAYAKEIADVLVF